MRIRYENCFSEQIRSRIYFKPELVHPKHLDFAGTTEQFINVIENNPKKYYIDKRILADSDQWAQTPLIKITPD